MMGTIRLLTDFNTLYNTIYSSKNSTGTLGNTSELSVTYDHGMVKVNNCLHYFQFSLKDYVSQLNFIPERNRRVSPV